MKASAALDASDPINVDDGYGGPGEELIFDVELRRVVRPKSAWMLERDRGAPQSWAHVQKNDPTDAQFDLDVHLRFSQQGVGVDGGAKIKMDVDAPWIPAKALEKELIQRNSVWREYPTESRPQKKDRGGVIDTHKHLKHPLEQLRRDAQTATVTTSCRRLGAGYRFNVTQHPSAAFNMELTVLSLTVDAVDPEMLQLDPKDLRTQRPFIATLQCAPADDYAPRPPISARRKFPMELATVIRWQESMDMVTEARNEVYVRLDWDVEREVDAKTWYARGNDKAYPLSTNRDGERDRVLRVPIVQPWAGNGYGLQVVPREGMQVLIGYIDSQGDRPVLLGCLHTDKNPPPWGPGYDAKRVGFRTQSAWPNGMMSDRAKAQDTIPPTGWSEISISDAESEERVYVHAAKDLAVDVTEAFVQTVGTDASFSVEGSYLRQVTHDSSHSTGGNHVDTIIRDERRSVGADQEVTIGGKQTTEITGPQEVRVIGGSTVATASLSAGIRGDMNLSVNGARSVIIGTPNSHTADDLRVYGDISATSDQEIRIRADKGITIACGTTILRLTPDGLQVTGKALAFGAAKQLTMESSDGPILTLDKQATLVAKTISLTADSASLKLDSDATVQGGSIALKKGSSGTSKSKDSPVEPGKKKLTLRFIDADRKVCANKRYHLSYDDVRIEGTTDGNGVLQEQVPKSLARCQVLLWHGDFPAGGRAQFVVDVAELPELKTPDGVRARLHGLGYDVGLGRPDVDAAMVEAVRTFQTHYADKHSLTVTGQVDNATLDALKTEFGH